MEIRICSISGRVALALSPRQVTSTGTWRQPYVPEGASEGEAAPAEAASAGYTCPSYTLETLEACEKLGGARAFRLVAELRKCSSVNQPGTGLSVTATSLTFRAKSAQYQLQLQWPQPIDESRAQKSFGKKTRQLTVLAPVL